MDPYSEILSGLKLQGAIFFRAEFSAPWFINAPPSPQLAAALGIENAHVVNFHLLTEGEAHVEMPTGSTLNLAAGEIVIFPHGDPHFLMSTDGACRNEDAAVATKVRARDLSPLRLGGGGAQAKFVCGYMACGPFFCRSVVSGLPTVITVNIRSDPAGRWVESSLLHLLEEVGSNCVGSEAVLAKLSEALFIEALRKYAAQLPEDRAGWLAAARDPHIGRALVLFTYPDSSPVDYQRSRPQRGPIAQRLHRSLFATTIHASDDLPDAAPNAPRGTCPGDQRGEHASHCGAGGLRVRGGVQSRLQSRVGHASCALSLEQ